MNHDELKRQAAARAAGMIEDGMKLGLGSGSTAGFVLEAIATRRERGELAGIVGVPTSGETRDHALRLGIPLTDLGEVTRLDLTIDGADEVDPRLDLIKGLGGALLWEKIVASVSDRFLIVVDERKLVDRLGTRSAVPVEVVPFGWQTVPGPVRELGAEPTLRQGDDGSPYRTDSGHYILDCRFETGIDDPGEVEARLRSLPAVVGTGLFLDMAEAVVVAAEAGVRLLSREAASWR